MCWPSRLPTGRKQGEAVRLQHTRRRLKCRILTLLRLQSFCDIDADQMPDLVHKAPGFHMTCGMQLGSVLRSSLLHMNSIETPDGW